ncbi:formate dehydrogenase subunit gamma [Puniceibacterium sp. IMCC21224]|uniref:formate dehydrogenase subunit gamma n=1 Tax=Puniceibacterium sp. IMCC21224 TaxID=1618204 RepID=UPI00065D5EC5|nr:formate dehydrogenase subunit gamma [Puniceibacterium sp. IMCC21224]KMK65747.1 formate dehydrogenase gamma subunit [Puniceibacterium sp. IMCC21224]
MTLISRLLCLIALCTGLIGTGSVHAQNTAEPAPVIDRSQTGGATTLEDILRRQQGLNVDNDYRADNIGNPDDAPPADTPLGTRGGASDPELWRALRFDEAQVSTQQRGPGAKVLIQDNGMWWLQFRRGPLITYGGYLLLGTIALLALFYLIRGRIRIEGEKTGTKLERFKLIERASHWMLAGSFLLLGFTGLISLMGRKFLIPTFGHDSFAFIATWSKWLHNNVSWAFIVALVLIFIMWVIHNLPDRTDINWILKGGGIIGHGHPPAKKFNVGQKLIFWSVIVLGSSIAVSGLSLLFPFEMPLFGATFAKINALGVPELLGFAPLPADLTPHQEMQYSQLWHAIVSFVLMAIILAHIYIGTLGMEGAYDAMGSGLVEEQWAKEHHSLWAEEVKARKGPSPKGATPAE